MISWKELKERRITQIVLTYVAAGWVVLAGVDQLADREVIPELAYRLALLAYLGGFFATLVLGWYHGEKGSQRVTLPEVALLAIVALGTGAWGFLVVRDYRADLLAAEGGVAESRFDPRRVAVLYFEDLGAGDELAHVADGFTEALIGELSGVRGLDVVSRNGVAPYRDAGLAADSVGRALEAGSVIRGTVEPVGERLRVAVRLVDAESGVDIERAGFTLPGAELLAARDSVVAQAANFLRTRLGEELRLRQRRSETGSVDAWTRVQQAERLAREAQEARLHDVDRARRLLERADSLLGVAEGLDPRWVEPVVGRARMALLRASWSGDARGAREAVAAGVAVADRALEMDPQSAPAWEVRGALHYLHWFLNVSPTPEERARLLDRAQSDLERAVELDPTLASALNYLSRLYYQRKDRISAALAARRAIEADAYLANAEETLNRLFWSHYDLGQFAEADRTCREAGTRFPADPRFQQCRLWMMIAPNGEPNPELAWELLARVDSLTPPAARPMVHRITKMVVGGVLARSGLPDSARAVLVDSRGGAEVDPNGELSGYEAIMRTLLGDQDEAVGRLRRYVSANPHHSFIEVEGDLHWWWRPLRGHPDFAAVVGSGY